MRLISLNTWSGKLFNPLIDFINSQKDSTDIFCFQEILNNNHALKIVDDGYRANLLDSLKEILTEYSYYFCTDFKIYQEGVKVAQGSAVFVKRPLKVLSEGKELIYKADNMIYDPTKNHSVNLVFKELVFKDKKFWIFSFHGIAFPGDKLDTQERIQQSQKIVEFLKTKKGLKILAGDFNLMPDTKSVEIIEGLGMKNLIKDFGIKDTRGQVNARMYPEGIQSFADYTFVSKEVKVEKFEVPQVEISDHLPMILDFDI